MNGGVVKHVILLISMLLITAVIWGVIILVALSTRGDFGIGA